MKHVVIIHGWGNNSQGNWFPWLKSKLKRRGYKVTIPNFPSTKLPRVSEWLKTLEKATGKADKNLILVGHSLGVNLIHHYLESLPRNTQINAAVCISTPTKISAKPYKQIHNFVQKDFNWEKIKQGAEKWFILGSDNDPYIPFSEIKKIPQLLGEKLILKKSQGHFNLEHSPKYRKFPFLLKIFDKIKTDE